MSAKQLQQAFARKRRMHRFQQETPMGFRVQAASKWPDGIVPYIFLMPDQSEIKKLAVAIRLKEVILECMKRWEGYVNKDGNYIRFIDKTGGDSSKVKLIDIQGNAGTACTSGVLGLGLGLGPQGGNKMIISHQKNLWYCIPHELGHVLGLAHEHEQNPYLEDPASNYKNNGLMLVAARNSIAGLLANNSQKKYEKFGSYDVNSIMHYPPGDGWQWNYAPANANIWDQKKKEMVPDITKETKVLADLKLRRNYPTSDQVQQSTWKPGQGDIATLRDLYKQTATTTTANIPTDNPTPPTK